MPESAIRLRRVKHAIFAALIAGAVYVFIEACAFCSYWAIFGERFSLAALRTERASRASVETFGQSTRRARGTPEVIHPYLGYVRNPDVHVAGIARPNRYGFLGARDPIEKRAQGKVIIGILGGSFAQSFARNGAPTLKQVLSTSPRFTGRQLVIVPLALAGYKEPQQLMVVTYLLSLGAEFDLLINIDGFNEIALHSAENANRGVFPAFPRNWATRVEDLPDPALQAMVGEAAYLRQKQTRWARKFPGLLDYSVTGNLVWRLRDRKLSQAVARQEAELHRYQPAPPGYAATGPRVHYESEEEVYDALTTIWKASSFQLARLCRENGIAYFHFLQPNQYVEGSKPMGRQERSVAYDASHPYRRGVVRGYPRLVRAGEDLAREGVAFSDLTMIFQAVPGAVYVDSCCHINRVGNTLLAKAVGAEILKRLDAGGA